MKKKENPPKGKDLEAGRKAPRAAARPKKEYRMLRVGQVIEAGDEFLSSWDNKWKPVKPENVGEKRQRYHVPFRRPIPKSASPRSAKRPASRPKARNSNVTPRRAG